MLKMKKANIKVKRLSKNTYLISDCCSSVAQSCPTLCGPMDGSTPGFSVVHHLLELAQTRAHRVRDAIQPSHPLSSPSPACSLSQHWGLTQMSQFFASDGQSIGVSVSTSVLPMNIQDWFLLGLTGLMIKPINNSGKQPSQTVFSPKRKAVLSIGSSL